ncbi:MAG: hypothetical protein ACD_75C00874G0004 [uncultured bacterium]|nr:MAG: hypothetical protein ACD_75C00874G0004 [uncultured bacterium]
MEKLLLYMQKGESITFPWKINFDSGKKYLKRRGESKGTFPVECTFFVFLLNHYQFYYDGKSKGHS